VKIAYPSSGADLKGLLKSAYYDPNPVVIFEHKGLYWSKIKGTEEARTIEPDEDYVIPFGKARVLTPANPAQGGEASLSIITYGMGVYWALNARKMILDKSYQSSEKVANAYIEIVDLRTLHPIDEASIFESVRKTNRCIVLTEESYNNSFAQALAGRISQHCFTSLDAPVTVIGAENLPAIPLNSTLEATMLPNADKVAKVIQDVLSF
jgi:2-oxoisovalerate dehydrogenase E1 component